MAAGLYIHVPFCRTKCGYCDFYSLPASEEACAAYTELVCRMLEHVPFGRQRFDTVYFGGGTPPLLGARAICRILETAAKHHTVEAGEITLEANPGEVDSAFFRDVAQGGVNRISIGLQSTDAAQLTFLGRRHTAGDAAGAVHAAREAGIANISLDVMLALPGQTGEELDHTLQFCGALDIQHVSAYLLKIEPGTRFMRDGVADLCPDEDAEASLYLHAAERLNELGFAQYEISNFARPGLESRHNLKYWRLEPYLGIGPAAHSFIGGRRRFFPRGLRPLLTAQDPWALLEDDGAGGDFEEYVMLRLRLREGLDLAQTARLYGHDSAHRLVGRAAALEAAGVLVSGAGRIALTARGFLLCNAVLVHLLDT